MRHAATALIAFTALTLCAGAAQARCAIGEFHAVVAGVTYDPFDVDAPAAPISVRASTTGDCRSARVQLAIVSTSQSPRTGSTIDLAAGSGLLNASVLDAGGGARTVAGTASSAFLERPPFLPLGAQGIQTSGASLRLSVTPGQPAAPATYVAHLLLAARVTDESGATTETETPLDLSVYVKPSVRLAAGSLDLSIDLGELKSGVVGANPIRFDAYSNIDYEINLRSANAFALARAGGGAGGPHYAPILTPTARSRAAADTVDTQRFLYDAPRGDGRRSHTLNVQLAPLDRQPAGAYSDDMTVEIRARL